MCKCVYTHTILVSPLLGDSCTVYHSVEWSFPWTSVPHKSLESLSFAPTENWEVWRVEQRHHSTNILKDPDVRVPLLEKQESENQWHLRWSDWTIGPRLQTQRHPVRKLCWDQRAPPHYMFKNREKLVILLGILSSSSQQPHSLSAGHRGKSSQSKIGTK